MGYWWRLGAVLAVSAHAATVVPLSLEDRARAADRVVVARVVWQRVEEQQSERIPLKTLTGLQVERDIRGSGPREVAVVQLGGRHGLLSVEIPGDASFAVGERAVVFLRCTKAATRCHVVGLGQGKLAIKNDAFEWTDAATQQQSTRALSELPRLLGVTP